MRQRDLVLELRIHRWEVGVEMRMLRTRDSLGDFILSLDFLLSRCFHHGWERRSHLM